MQNKKSKTLAFLLIGIVLFFLFITNTGIMGQVVCQSSGNFEGLLQECKFKSEKLESELLILSTNISSYNSFNNRLLERIEISSKEKLELESLSKQDKEKIQVLETNLDTSQIKYQNLEEKYLALSRNTANNLCCKMRIDNPDINFYEIQNNKIICLEGGTKSLSC